MQQVQTASSGLLDKCPSYGSSKVRWWSQLTGYSTDVSAWNEGKRQDLKAT